MTLQREDIPTDAIQHRDIYVRSETGTNGESILAFGNAHLILRFDYRTGSWLSLHATAVDGSGGGPDQQIVARPTDSRVLPALLADFRVGGKAVSSQEPLPSEFPPSKHDIKRDEKADSVTLSWTTKVSVPAVGDFDLTVSFVLLPGDSCLERTARLTNTGDSSVFVDGFDFHLPGFAAGDPECCRITVPGPWWPKTYIAPGTAYPEVARRLSEASIRLHSAPDAGFGVVVLDNPDARFSLAVWTDTNGGETGYRPTLYAGDAGRLTLSSFERRSVWLAPGESVQTGAQCIAVAPGGASRDALAKYRAWGQVAMPLAETPDWVRDMVLLEVYPSLFPDGFRGITARLAFWRNIGFNTIYLMPHWEGGYSPRDLFAVDAAMGTAEELRQLVAEAHRIGMKFLFDMVIHGFHPESRVVKERPEMFARDADGTLALHETWKSVSTDWANPEYREYMTDLARHDSKEYGIDGYRVDAASYKNPSHASGLPYPAYASGSAAPALMREMLAVLRQDNPDAVLLSEVFGPVFYTVCNLAHDNQTESPAHFLERMERGEATAAEYRDAIETARDALPLASVNRVYFARNHDTSWFYRFGGYTPRFLAMDAVHAFCGIPEVFAGDPKNGPNPDDSPEVWEFYRKLFGFRRKNPAITRGHLRLSVIECSDPMVFAGARSYEGKLTLFLISFRDGTANVTVKMPWQLAREFSKTARFEDPMDTESNLTGEWSNDGNVSTKLKVALGAFQIACASDMPVVL